MYMDKKKDTPKDNIGAFFQTCKVKEIAFRYCRRILDL